MDIRSSLDGLNSLLGVNSGTHTAVQKGQAGAASMVGSALSSDQATVSSAGSEVAQMGADAEVRGDKVAQIRSALAAGTYSAPAAAVASKLVDAMLGNSMQGGR